MTRSSRALIACVLLALFAAACGGDGGNGDGDDVTVEERDISFKTEDDVTLTGRLFGDSSSGVVLAHMYPSDARSWYPAARRFASSGYMALAFNFRGYADSSGEKSPSKAPIDVRGAIAKLQALGADDLALVGASMGGTASIIAAEDRTALAVVAISAPARFQSMDAIIVAQNVQRPVLLMASRGDDEAFGSLQELERALPNPDTKIFDGSAHGTALLSDRPEAVDEIVAFLERYAPTNGVPQTTPAETEGT